MLQIYVEKITPRIRYVMHLYFGELIRTEFEITDDVNRFQSFGGAKLNYSTRRIGDECFLPSAALLAEKEIHETSIRFGEWKGITTLFAHDQEGELPFDPFAAAFYLVTRYEEYLPFTADEYGRFPDRENSAVREGFHELPVVNHYALGLMDILKQRYPALKFEADPFRFQLTYDIDFAFAFRGKGLPRHAGGFAASVLKFDWSEALHRMNVLIGTEKDPYDTYEFQFSMHDRYALEPIYFFLLADYARYDKNNSWKDKKLQALIRKIDARWKTGIHSSFASNEDHHKVRTEADRLSAITSKKVVRNRQHFLKLKFPDTYQTLLACGITEDYTMGFASLTGFRAGIAAPFQWYDLSKEESTSLRLFPFAVMDATLHYYLKLPAEEALAKTKSLMDEVKKVNGYFQFLAHNDLLSESSRWNGWREKFESVLAYSRT